MELVSRLLPAGSPLHLESWQLDVESNGPPTDAMVSWRLESLLCQRPAWTYGAGWVRVESQEFPRTKVPGRAIVEG